MKWIRKRVGWIAAAAVGGFLLWIVGTVVSLRTMKGQEAGVLFGRKVPLVSYLHATEAVTHQAILRYGGRYQKEFPPQRIDEAAWERLMLLTEAKRQAIHASDEEVVAKLREYPLFQTDGRFDFKGYQNIIQYNLHTTARNFEEEIREDLLIQKLFEHQTAHVTVTDEEVKTAFRRREEAIRIHYLVLPREDLAQEVAHAARGNPKQLERVAKQLHLTVAASGFFKRTSSIPEIGSTGLTFERAFSLQPAEVTGPFKTRQGWIVARLEAKEPADERKFPEMKESLQAELSAQKRFRDSLTWYQDLLQRAALKKSLPAPQKSGGD